MTNSLHICIYIYLYMYACVCGYINVRTRFLTAFFHRMEFNFRSLTATLSCFKQACSRILATSLRHGFCNRKQRATLFPQLCLSSSPVFPLCASHFVGACPGDHFSHAYASRHLFAFHSAHGGMQPCVTQQLHSERQKFFEVTF